MCVCMYVCMYVCVYVCMYVCNTWLDMTSTELSTQHIPVFSKTLTIKNDYSPKQHKGLFFTVGTQWACWQLPNYFLCIISMHFKFQSVISPNSILIYLVCAQLNVCTKTDWLIELYAIKSNHLNSINGTSPWKQRRNTSDKGLMSNTVHNTNNRQAYQK